MDTNPNLEKAVPYRPISRVEWMVNGCGYVISYAYDDLVFIEENNFLLKMGEKGEDVFLYFNVDFEKSAQGKVSRELISKGSEFGLNVKVSGFFTAKNRDDGQVDLVFS